MKRFLEWLVVSEAGLFITVIVIAFLIVLVVAFTPRRPVTPNVDISMMTVERRADVWSIATQEYVYDQVATLNSIEYKGLHDLLGIDQVYDYDWVETAFSLDVPVDSLTIPMYIKHLVRNE